MIMMEFIFKEASFISFHKSSGVLCLGTVKEKNPKYHLYHGQRSTNQSSESSMCVWRLCITRSHLDSKCDGWEERMTRHIREMAFHLQFTLFRSNFTSKKQIWFNFSKCSGLKGGHNWIFQRKDSDVLCRHLQKLVIQKCYWVTSIRSLTYDQPHLRINTDSVFCNLTHSDEQQCELDQHAQVSQS